MSDGGKKYVIATCWRGLKVVRLSFSQCSAMQCYWFHCMTAASTYLLFSWNKTLLLKWHAKVIVRTWAARTWCTPHHTKKGNKNWLFREFLQTTVKKCSVSLQPRSVIPEWTKGGTLKLVSIPLGGHLGKCHNYYCN